ncbi:FAD-dependent monooxygenase [Enemella sp. A6]|uniref:FAD-dependent monooxygenase n=1 Tax=Enemella sp. A6 TaxID=3440152 RepID=UPI003EB7263E
MRVGIIGGGIGGLALAVGLMQRGVDVRVFERTAAFGQVGADINLTPNATRAVDGLHPDLGRHLREVAARPARRLSRVWDTGEITSDLPMSDEAERKYGAPQLTIHRAALLDGLKDLLPDGVLSLGKRLTRFSTADDNVTGHFADETTDTVDALIGADGIHSVVRTQLFGADQAEYTGLVAYRAVVPTSRLTDVPNLDAFTKWWGPDPSTQIVTFPLNRGHDTFIFATVAQPEWNEESWTSEADADEFRHHYAEFHPDARRLIDACDTVMKSALRVREPMESWGEGRVTLLGDACHPMTPFMAQGAGQALEDAVVLTRALTEGEGGVAERLRRYERARRERTARIQLGSRANDWLKDGQDGDWLYGHDVWTVSLD